MSERKRVEFAMGIAFGLELRGPGPWVRISPIAIIQVAGS
jgi:hypothetical protein